MVLETCIPTSSLLTYTQGIVNQPQAEAFLSQYIRNFSNQGKQFEPHQQQISYLLNKHQLYPNNRPTNKFIYNYPLLLMNQPNLPSLSLFNKTGFKSRREFTTAAAREDSPFFDAIKETNRIDNQIYTTYLPYRPIFYEPQYIPPPYHLHHHPIPLQPLYVDRPREPIHSFNTTHRSRSSYLQKQINAQHLIQAQHLQSRGLSRERQIIKTPYVNHQYVPNAAYKNQAKENIAVPSKDVYLKKQDQQRKKEDPQASIIQKINPSMLDVDNKKNINNNNNPNVNVNVNANLSKIINESNYMHTNQSLMIDAPRPQPKKQTVSQQVQTDEINRSSFFVETRKVKKMDQASFKKTIKDLNLQINNLNLDMESEDIIIDLSDLVLTKDQYIEESRSILRDLQILSDQRTSSGIMIKSKKQTEMIWPQF